MENCHQRAKENIPTVQLDRGLMCAFYLQASLADADMDSPELNRVSVVQEASDSPFTEKGAHAVCEEFCLLRGEHRGGCGNADLNVSLLLGSVWLQEEYCVLSRACRTEQKARSER